MQVIANFCIAAFAMPPSPPQPLAPLPTLNTPPHAHSWIFARISWSRNIKYSCKYTRQRTERQHIAAQNASRTSSPTLIGAPP